VPAYFSRNNCFLLRVARCVPPLFPFCISRSTLTHVLLPPLFLFLCALRHVKSGIEPRAWPHANWQPHPRCKFLPRVCFPAHPLHMMSLSYFLFPLSNLLNIPLPFSTFFFSSLPIPSAFSLGLSYSSWPSFLPPPLLPFSPFRLCPSSPVLFFLVLSLPVCVHPSLSSFFIRPPFRSRKCKSPDRPTPARPGPSFTGEAIPGAVPQPETILQVGASVLNCVMAPLGQPTRPGRHQTHTLRQTGPVALAYPETFPWVLILMLTTVRPSRRSIK